MSLRYRVHNQPKQGSSAPLLKPPLRLTDLLLRDGSRASLGSFGCGCFAVYSPRAIHPRLPSDYGFSAASPDHHSPLQIYYLELARREAWVRLVVGVLGTALREHCASRPPHDYESEERVIRMQYVHPSHFSINYLQLSIVTHPPSVLIIVLGLRRLSRVQFRQRNKPKF
jgi:hypothetical protein